MVHFTWETCVRHHHTLVLGFHWVYLWHTHQDSQILEQCCTQNLGTWVLPISPPSPWSVAMKVNWPVVRKVTMVIRICKVILCSQGWSSLLVTLWMRGTVVRTLKPSITLWILYWPRILAQFESEHSRGFTNPELPHQGRGHHFFIRVDKFEPCA